eukprot:TRINITY_DN8127_c0_g3_i4.p1 TRINITY_DN8127_c0_g3~~TRINITY_DN8127_c0_g3_i4.p1  ORF type:complete len:582 (+),score=127.42 TRINITY_DN8127_c0_g3_i4:81-1826(+)
MINRDSWMRRNEPPALPRPCVAKAACRASLPGSAERTRLWHLQAALARWEPRLSTSDGHLPDLLALPLKVFGADDVLAFEFALVLLLNWCRPWLQEFPAPAMGIAQQVIGLLECAAPDLVANLVSECGKADEASGSSGILLRLVWTMLSSLLSSSLLQEDWLALWDHLVARWREPRLLGACVAALFLHRLRGPGRARAASASTRRGKRRSDAGCRSQVRSDEIAGKLLTPLQLGMPVDRLLQRAESLLARFDASSQRLSPSAEAADLQRSSAQEDAVTALPLPGSSQAYPVLPAESRPSSTEVGHPLLRRGLFACDDAHLSSDLWSGEIQGEVQLRAQRAREDLAQAAEELLVQGPAMARNRMALYREAAEDLARFSSAAHYSREQGMNRQLLQAEQMKQDLQGELQHYEDRLEAENAYLLEELGRLRRLGADALTVSLDEQGTLEASEKALKDVLSLLHRRRDEAAGAHAERTAAYRRNGLAAWAERQRELSAGETETQQRQLEHCLARRDEGRRVEAIARLQRRVEADLDSERLDRELRLLRGDHDRALDLAEVRLRALAEDEARLEERRFRLDHAGDA